MPLPCGLGSLGASLRDGMGRPSKLAAATCGGASSSASQINGAATAAAKAAASAAGPAKARTALC